MSLCKPRIDSPEIVPNFVTHLEQNPPHSVIQLFYRLALCRLPDVPVASAHPDSG
jgi:hypothetical protein